jgi:hypothetical protein
MIVPTASFYVPGLQKIEHLKGKIVIPAHGDRCCIHYFKVFRQHFCITYFFIFNSISVLYRIGVVNTIHLGRLEQDIGPDLDGAKGRRSIGRKIGVARSGSKDDHPPLLQVADCPPLDVWFGNRFHFDSRLQAGIDVQVFQGALECKTVDHRREHAHIIGGGSIHPAATRIDAAKDISATNDDPKLHPDHRDITDFGGHDIHDLGIDAKGSFTRKGFTAQFQQYPPIVRLIHLSYFCSSPSWNLENLLTTIFSPVLAIILFTSVPTVMSVSLINF